MKNPLKICYAICRLLLTLCLIAVPAVALSQDIQKIAAIVNDEIISGYDLEQRVALTILLSGFPDTPETRNQLRQQTLSRLIDDRLKAQEAAKYNISVSDEEANAALIDFEKRNNIEPGELDRNLASKGIALQSLLEQFRVRILWNRIVQRRIMSRIVISDEEVAAVQARMEANKGKNEYLLYEIFLPFDPATPELQLQQGIAGLANQIRQGASFERAAAQFSQGATASNGGAIGWVLEEDVPDEIAEILPSLFQNDVSDPIRTQDGFFLITIRGSRTVMQSSPDDVTVNLTQLVVPAPPSQNTSTKRQQEQLATTLSNMVDGCGNLPTLLSELEGSNSSELGRLRMGDLPDKIKDHIKDVEVGKASPPYEDDDVYRIFVVCGRDDPQTRSNDPQKIREEILLRRAENRARGYLQDMHNAATIETR
ncbi:MAG: peptidylprolyl isomerase [Proteobacteria bacterium]|nr:peptidylprolyl isomerase [Pseudomonadota bacterium]